MVGRLRIYNSNIESEIIERERKARFLSLTGKERFFELVKLNSLAVLINGGKPLKVPQGKGIIIKKIGG